MSEIDASGDGILQRWRIPVIGFMRTQAIVTGTISRICLSQRVTIGGPGGKSSRRSEWGCSSPLVPL